MTSLAAEVTSVRSDGWACSVCEHPTIVHHRMSVLKKHDVAYGFCKQCGLLQTERPHWLDEAYSDVIATSDTGLIRRNIGLSLRLAAVLGLLFNRSARFADVGGGYGLLTRLMRDYGFDYYWWDPYCSNLFARGFEAVSETTEHAAITAFEVMEHVYDPLSFIQEHLRRFRSGTFLFSTQLFEGAPPIKGWPYYSPETGQHVSFYQLRTLTVIAERLKLQLHSTEYFHMLTDKPISSRAFKVFGGRFAPLFFPVVLLRLRSRTVADRDSALAGLRTSAGESK